MSKETAAPVDRQPLNAPYEALKEVQEQARARMERVNRILRESKDAVAARKAAAQRG